MTLSEYIILSRKERGFTQRMLAERSKVSPAEICRIEKGARKQPSPAILKAFSEALLVSYADLMKLAGYTEAKEKPQPKEFSRVLVVDDGNIVDIAEGANTMYNTDKVWAATAYRACTLLSKDELHLLNEITEAFLAAKGRKKKK